MDTLDDEVAPPISRQMLAEAHCFVKAQGQLAQAHQSDVLALGIKSVSAVRRSVNDALAAKGSQAAAAKAEHEAALASHGAALAAEKLASRELAEREEEFERENDSAEAAHHAIKLACAAEARARKSLAALEAERARTAEFFNGPLRALLGQGAMDPAVREQALSALLGHDLLLSAEGALIAAIRPALARSSAERRPFDTVTIRALVEHLEAGAAEADASIAVSEQRSTEAATRVTASLTAHDLARTKAEVSVDALASARKAKAASEAALAESEANAEKLQRARSDVLVDEALLEERSRELAVALEALVRLAANPEEKLADGAAAPGLAC